MIFRLNQSTGIPLYLQLIEQVKHAVETGALQEGDQLPTIRKVAEDLVMNPNTVVRAYRELEHDGVLELKHGSGAFIKESAGGRARVMRKAQAVVQSARCPPMRRGSRHRGTPLTLPCSRPPGARSGTRWCRSTCRCHTPARMSMTSLR